MICRIFSFLLFQALTILSVSKISNLASEIFELHNVDLKEKNTTKNKKR